MWWSIVDQSNDGVFERSKSHFSLVISVNEEKPNFNNVCAKHLRDAR